MDEDKENRNSEPLSAESPVQGGLPFKRSWEGHQQPSEGDKKPRGLEAMEAQIPNRHRLIPNPNRLKPARDQNVAKGDELKKLRVNAIAAGGTGWSSATKESSATARRSSTTSGPKRLQSSQPASSAWPASSAPSGTSALAGLPQGEEHLLTPEPAQPTLTLDQILDMDVVPASADPFGVFARGEKEFPAQAQQSTPADGIRQSQHPVFESAVKSWNFYSSAFMILRGGYQELKRVMKCQLEDLKAELRKVDKSNKLEDLVHGDQLEKLQVELQERDREITERLKDNEKLEGDVYKLKDSIASLSALLEAAAVARRAVDHQLEVEHDARLELKAEKAGWLDERRRLVEASRELQEELRAQKMKLEGQIEKLEAQLRDMVKRHKELEVELQQANERAHQSALGQAQLASTINVAEERNKLLTARMEKSEAERDEAREKATRLLEEIRQLDKQIEGHVTAPAKCGSGVPDDYAAKLKSESMELQLQLRLKEEKLQEEQGKLVIMEGRLNSLRDENDRFRTCMAIENDEKRSLKNLIQELKGNIQVFCRVRPLHFGECGHTQAGPIIKYLGKERNKIQLMNEHSAQRTFTYDKVFGPETPQVELFNDVAQFIQSSLDAYKVCLFSYGQTGTGKTHTMLGSMESENLKGIMPRAFDLLFEETMKMKAIGGRRFTLLASFVEIYREDVVDLLEGYPGAYKPDYFNTEDPKDAEAAGPASGVGADVRHSKNEAAAHAQGSSWQGFKGGRQPKGGVAFRSQGCNLIGTRGITFCDNGGQEEQRDKEKTIRHSNKGFTVVDDTFEVELMDRNLAIDLVKYAARKRTVGATCRNAQSSRSHCALMIRIRIEDGEDVKWGALNLVDLAGSEGNKDLQDGNEEQRKESTKINWGLLQLGNVFRELKAKRKPRYRDSKLTHLLQLCFSTPRSRLLMVLNISPAAESFQQTKSACIFGEDANSTCVNLALKAHGGSFA